MPKPKIIINAKYEVGFPLVMYVKKVVIPAIISVFTVVLFSFNLNIKSSFINYMLTLKI